MLNRAGHTQASTAPTTHGRCLGYVSRAEAGKTAQVQGVLSQRSCCPGVGELCGTPRLCLYLLIRCTALLGLPAPDADVSCDVMP